jgi:hypothetical protein
MFFEETRGSEMLVVMCPRSHSWKWQGWGVHSLYRSVHTLSCHAQRRLYASLILPRPSAGV